MKIKNWTMSNLKVIVFIVIFLFCSIYVYAENGQVSNCFYLNMRKGAGIQYGVLMLLKQGDEAEVFEESDGWYKISCRGETGWVKSKYLDKYSINKTENMVKSIGYINGDIVNARSGGSLVYKVLYQLKLNDEVSIIKENNSWCKVISNGRVGWVYSPLISSKMVEKQESELKTGSTENLLRSKVIDVAKSLLGAKYVWGGTGETSSGKMGFDCSGFVQYVYKKCGIDLKRTSSAQSNQGKWTPKSELRPGDLVFFDTNGGTRSINHVAIYMNDGKMIHSSTYNKDVIISDMNKDYYRRTYVTSKNVID